MKKLQLIERWKNTDFINSIEFCLNEVFTNGRSDTNCDFRGIRVGSEGTMPLLKNSDFQHKKLSNIDLTYSNISSSFIGGEFNSLNFTKSKLDSCRMSKAKFTNCNFDNVTARVDLTDSYFENCCFDKGKFIGKGLMEYGGRRVNFIRSSFRNAKFNGVELRASKFIDCNFEATIFVKCDLRGVKFDQFVQNQIQFINCQL